MTQQSSSIQSHNRVRVACAIVGTFTLFFLSPFFINSSLYAAVVINEVYPKTEPANLEWVELYNTGSELVSLDRWRLQNSAGVVTTFILNASARIASHGFLTFPGSQTNISFAIDGDTVRLFDEKNGEVDSQWYPGILGYNTSMGRSSDGNGSWTICTTATYNKPNNCPEPSPTFTPIGSGPTPLPTNMSTPTPTPLPIKTPPPQPQADAPDRQTFGSLLPSPTQTHVLGAGDIPSPTPTPDPTSLTLKIDTILATQILLVAIVLGVIASVAIVVYMLRKKRHRRTV